MKKILGHVARRSLQEYRQRILYPSQARSPALLSFIAGHWVCPPFTRQVLRVARAGALGDVLLCTPVLKAARSLNPHLKIHFYTKYPSLLKGLDFIDEVHPYWDKPVLTIDFAYEHCLPPKRHIARIFAEQIGIRLNSVTPSCAVDPTLVARFQSQYTKQGRPLIVINQKAGPWTPNKDWPLEYWQELRPKLCELGTVVEIGQPVPGESEVRSDNYHDLRGKTSLDELVAIIAVADLHVGPISGPVHIAAAFNVPSVVIYGGYEDPVCSTYPGNINLRDQPECSPCWLRDPCPHSRQCLYAIRPCIVYDAVLQLLSQGPQR